MKFKALSAFALAAFLFVGTSCDKDEDPTPTPTPKAHTITSFTAVGQVGGSIEIEGTNFSTDKKDIKVVFLGDAADNSDDKTVSETELVQATATKLMITVPADVVTGKITVMQGTKTVATATDFTVSAAATITQISLAKVAKTGMLDIEGTNFLTEASDVEVTFLGADGDADNKVVATADVTATATKITVKVPADAVAGLVQVQQTGFLAVKTAAAVELAEVHTVTEPTTDATIGAEFVIAGTNFSTTVADIKVMFATTNSTVEATVTAATATEIKVTVPADAVTGKVKVAQFGLAVMTTGDVTVK